jgi:16S rRNA processing protein RimM
MQLDNYFEIGHILKPHGLKGGLSIILDVDEPANYTEMESVIVNIDNQLVPFFISSLQLNGAKGILHLEDIDTLEEADRFRSSKLLLPIEILPELNNGKFYYHEVIGYQVVDEQTGRLGIIENVFTRSNQDLISMRYQNKEVLIPANNDIVKKADHEKKEVIVDLPNGLLEIYL